MVKRHLTDIVVTYYIAGMLLFYVVADIKPFSPDLWKWGYYFWNLSWEPMIVICLIQYVKFLLLKASLWVLASFMLIRLLWNVLEITDYKGVLTSPTITRIVIVLLSFTILLLTFLPQVITACKTLKRRWQR